VASPRKRANEERKKIALEVKINRIDDLPYDQACAWRRLWAVLLADEPTYTAQFEPTAQDNQKVNRSITKI
jgi:hypothetical protein